MGRSQYFVAMRCMHLSIDELRKRITLCIILLSSAENITSPNYNTPASLGREGFEGTRTPSPKQFNAALRPRRRTTVREAEYEYKVGKRDGTGDQGF